MTYYVQMDEKGKGRVTGKASIETKADVLVQTLVGDALFLTTFTFSVFLFLTMLLSVQ